MSFDGQRIFVTYTASKDGPEFVRMSLKTVAGSTHVILLTFKRIRFSMSASLKFIMRCSLIKQNLMPIYLTTRFSILDGT